MPRFVILEHDYPERHWVFGNPKCLRFVGLWHKDVRLSALPLELDKAMSEEKRAIRALSEDEIRQAATATVEQSYQMTLPQFIQSVHDGKLVLDHNVREILVWLDTLPEYGSLLEQQQACLAS